MRKHIFQYVPFIFLYGGGQFVIEVDVIKHYGQIRAGQECTRVGRLICLDSYFLLPAT